MCRRAPRRAPDRGARAGLPRRCAGIRTLSRRCGGWRQRCRRCPGRRTPSPPTQLKPSFGQALLRHALAIPEPMGLRDRQRLTGALTWAGLQHRLHLPFLSTVHSWTPRHRRLPPPSVREAALRASLLAALPWTGQGFLPTALAGTPHVFFDGTKGIAAAVFIPPATGIVLPLPSDTSQQQSEMVAAELCFESLLASELRAVIVAGDSTATLGSLRKLSTPARFAHRAQCLQRIAISVLQQGVRFSLAKVP
eukprot:gene15141-biopygen2139